MYCARTYALFWTKFCYFITVLNEILTFIRLHVSSYTPTSLQLYNRLFVLVHTDTLTHIGIRGYVGLMGLVGIRNQDTTNMLFRVVLIFSTAVLVVVLSSAHSLLYLLLSIMGYGPNVISQYAQRNE